MPGRNDELILELSVAAWKIVSLERKIDSLEKTIEDLKHEVAFLKAELKNWEGSPEVRALDD